MYIYEETKNIMSKNGLNFKKKFGQNFLIDHNILNKIIENAKIDDKTFVIEIGPGIGTLSLEILKKAKFAILIETDKDLEKILKKRFEKNENVLIISEDILKVDIDKIINETISKNVELKKIKDKGELKIKVVANLPYYITSPILEKLVLSNEILDINIQKEVADRICATLKKDKTSSLTYFIRYFSNVRDYLLVKANCFMPIPKVDSAFISLDMISKENLEKKEKELNYSRDKLFKLIKDSFIYKRKTFLNSLKLANKYDMNKIENKLEELNLDKRIRPEEILLEEYIEISKI